MKSSDAPSLERAYPQSFHPDALWSADEICGYLCIRKTYFYEVEHKFNSFKCGQRRVAKAGDVIAYADRLRLEQNPLAKAR